MPNNNQKKLDLDMFMDQEKFERAKIKLSEEYDIKNGILPIVLEKIKDELMLDMKSSAAPSQFKVTKEAILNNDQKKYIIDEISSSMSNFILKFRAESFEFCKECLDKLILVGRDDNLLNFNDYKEKVLFHSGRDFLREDQDGMYKGIISDLEYICNIISGNFIEEDKENIMNFLSKNLDLSDNKNPEMDHLLESIKIFSLDCGKEYINKYQNRQDLIKVLSHEVDLSDIEKIEEGYNKLKYVDIAKIIVDGGDVDIDELEKLLLGSDYDYKFDSDEANISLFLNQSLEERRSSDEKMSNNNSLDLSISSRNSKPSNSIKLESFESLDLNHSNKIR